MTLQGNLRRDISINLGSTEVSMRESSKKKAGFWRRGEKKEKHHTRQDIREERQEIGSDIKRAFRIAKITKRVVKVIGTRNIVALVRWGLRTKAEARKKAKRKKTVKKFKIRSTKAKAKYRKRIGK